MHTYGLNLNKKVSKNNLYLKHQSPKQLKSIIGCKHLILCLCQCDVLHALPILCFYYSWCFLLQLVVCVFVCCCCVCVFFWGGGLVLPPHFFLLIFSFEIYCWYCICPEMQKTTDMAKYLEENCELLVFFPLKLVRGSGKVDHLRCGRAWRESRGRQRERLEPLASAVWK